MKVVHFGAGSIGRGLIGDLLSSSKFDICFADLNEDIINQLNQDKSYTIILTDNDSTKKAVQNIKAINSKDSESVIEAVVNTDLITTSVGSNNLKYIAQVIIKGLEERSKLSRPPIDIIVNENAVNAGDILKEEILKISGEQADYLKNTGFINSAIDRQASTIVENNKAIALVEPYYEWIISKEEIKNPQVTLEIKDAIYVSDIRPYIERKLYIVNAAHVATAYIGFLYRKETIVESLADYEIYSFVTELMKENSQYLIDEYNFDSKELKNFVKKSLQRHSNPNMKDDIHRVARDPIRKLAHNDRIVAPVIKLTERELPVKYGVKLIAAAISYYNEDNEEAVKMHEMKKSLGVENTIKKITSIEDENLLDQIEKEYFLLQEQYMMSDR